MKVIFKYTLAAIGTQSVEMPVGSQILSLDVQNNQVQLWAMVDPNEREKENIKIEMMGTGHAFTIPDEFLKFIGTVQLSGGKWVFHIFQNLSV